MVGSNVRHEARSQHLEASQTVNNCDNQDENLGEDVYASKINFKNTFNNAKLISFRWLICGKMMLIDYNKCVKWFNL